MMVHPKWKLSLFEIFEFEICSFAHPHDVLNPFLSTMKHKLWTEQKICEQIIFESNYFSESADHVHKTSLWMKHLFKNQTDSFQLIYSVIRFVLFLKLIA